jgi:hypothetical protein
MMDEVKLCGEEINGYAGLHNLELKQQLVYQGGMVLALRHGPAATASVYLETLYVCKEAAAAHRSCTACCSCCQSVAQSTAPGGFAASSTEAAWAESILGSNKNPTNDVALA